MKTWGVERVEIDKGIDGPYDAAVHLSSTRSRRWAPPWRRRAPPRCERRRQLHDHHPRAAALRGRRLGAALALWFVAHERQRCGSRASRTRSSTCSSVGSRPTPTASTSTCAAPRSRPPRWPTSAGRHRGGARRARRRARRPRRHAHRELARGDAGLVGHRASAARVAVPINTAYKGEYLRHQLADSGARVLVVEADLAERAARIVDEIADARARRGASATPSRRSRTAVHRWDDLLGRRAGAVRRRRARRDLGDLRLHRRHHRARRRAACSATTTTRRCPARSASAGGAPPTTWCGRRCRCSTSTPSSPPCSGRWSYGGRAAIYRRFSVSNFWPEMNRVGATITSTLGTMAYLLANDVDRPEMPRSGAPEANTTLRLHRRRAAAGRDRPHAAASASASTRSAAPTA